jgi:Protein of unknown function DUF262/Protein of unknown function (DUF1524)
MAGTNFQTSNRTFREIMGNGIVYTVPPFQRDYSWDKDEWSDLWEDIIDIYDKEEEYHYMGYLVLQSKNEDVYDVIDGQQRLTTLSILVIAIIRNIKRLIDSGIDVENNERRIEGIRNTYLGSMNYSTLISIPKLTLNRNNKKYYEYYMLPSRTMPTSGIKESEKLLRNALEYFDRCIKERKDIASSGENLVDFLDSIVKRLVFTSIQVSDQLNAFKVFETLNARGVRLSSTDLLKNYLFSVVLQSDPHEIEIETLEDTWTGISSRLEEEKFSDFLRAYWNSQKPLVRHVKLYSTIRQEISDKPSTVFSLLADLDSASEVYVALTRPNDTFWDDKDETSEIRRLLHSLNLFDVKQPIPLLLATYRKMPDKFVRVLKICVIISFRYNVIGNMQANKQENIYNDTAIKIEKGEIINISSLFNNMREIYPNDDQFKSAFLDKIFVTKTKRNKDIVRYILSHIEQKLSGFDIESSTVHNIEHVFPQNPSVSWGDIPHNQPNQRDHFLYRLGNLTLLEASLNYQIGNGNFEQKKIGYAKSALKINQQLAEFPEWDTRSILRRQEWLAGQAVKIWREELA